MIPDFPDFRKLEQEDGREIIELTKSFPPYSDYNFTSLWCWDTRGEIRLSKLHDNLVVRFSDYITGEGFYSFFGLNKPNETAEKLLEKSVQDGLSDVLRLVPETSIEGLDLEKFTAKEELGSFDYVFNIKALCAYKDAAFATKRNLVNRLLRKYPDTEARRIDLSSSSSADEIITLFRKWESNKSVSAGEEVDFEHEEKALSRIFLLKNISEMIGVGVYVDSKLSAFSINEVLGGEFCISHFAKADNFSAGLYAFLMRETAKQLDRTGKSLLNYEQDLDLPELRLSKTSFRPCAFLRKYGIRLSEQSDG